MIAGHEHQRHRDGAAALVGAERDRLEQVRRAGLASGQAGWRALDMSWSPTHRIRRPGCWAWSTSGHTQPIGRRSPEASLSRLVLHLGDGDAVRQVEVGAPAGAVAGDRGLELDRGLAGSWPRPG